MEGRFVHKEEEDTLPIWLQHFQDLYPRTPTYRGVTLTPVIDKCFEFALPERLQPIPEDTVFLSLGVGLSKKQNKKSMEAMTRERCYSLTAPLTPSLVR